MKDLNKTRCELLIRATRDGAQHADAELAAVGRGAVEHRVVAEAADLVLEHVQRHNATPLESDVGERQRRRVALAVECVDRLVLLRRGVTRVKDAVERRAADQLPGASRARREKAELVTAFWIACEDARLASTQLPPPLVEPRHDHIVLAPGGHVVCVRVERQRAVKRVG